VLALEQAAVNDFKEQKGFDPLTTVSGLEEEYVTGISVFQESKASGRNPTAVVSRYLYEKGLTIQTTVDLKEDKVVKFEPLPNFPTPLAPAELSKAIKLARDKNARVRQILEGIPDDEIRPDILVLHAGSPSDPRFGHRLVRLSFTDPKNPKQRAKVTVDLSDGSVEQH